MQSNCNLSLAQLLGGNRIPLSNKQRRSAISLETERRISLQREIRKLLNRMSIALMTRESTCNRYLYKSQCNLHKNCDFIRNTFLQAHQNEFIRVSISIAVVTIESASLRSSFLHSFDCQAKTEISF